MKIRALYAILSLLISSNAYGALPPLKKTHVFDDWTLYEGIKDNKKECHAITYPYRTRAFKGVRSKPWIAVNFVGRDEFTVSANNGLNIDYISGLLLSIDTGIKISLEVLDNGQIWSYSSMQDAHLINALMQGNAYFTTRSYTTDNQTALDYYSLKGFNNIIKYMNKHC